MSRQQPGLRAKLALYLLYITLTMAGSFGAGLWLAVAAHAFSARAEASTAAATPAATIPAPETMPVPTFTPQAPTATPVPTFTPQAPTATPSPSSSPKPSPTPTPARPPAARAPTRIVAAAIGLDAPVIEVGYKRVLLGRVPAAEWLLAANAAGFHLGSAYPGHAGNTVLSGHNNIKGEVFRHLVDLKPGDEVILYVASTPYRYRVSSNETLLEKGQPAAVRIANAQRIAPTADERLTLVTCWPYTSNTHRVIVVAFPVP